MDPKPDQLLQIITGAPPKPFFAWRPEIAIGSDGRQVVEHVIVAGEAPVDHARFYGVVIAEVPTRDGHHRRDIYHHTTQIPIAATTIQEALERFPATVKEWRESGKLMRQVQAELEQLQGGRILRPGL